MFLEGLNYEDFFEKIKVDEIKLIGIIEENCIVSALFKASVVKALNSINKDIKVSFMDRHKEKYTNDFNFVFPKLLVYKNNILVETIYGFKNWRKVKKILLRTCK